MYSKYMLFNSVESY